MTHMDKVYRAEQCTKEAAQLMIMIRTREDLEAWLEEQGTDAFTLFVASTAWQPVDFNTYQLCPGTGWNPKIHVFIAPELGRQLDTWDFRISAYEKMLSEGRKIVNHFSGHLSRDELMLRLGRAIDPLTHTINGKERKSWTKN